MLYLLDSNDAANFPAHRGITSQLYGGAELRRRQELVLGLGGWRLLEALGLQPEVCHLNEGRAAFAVLERAGSFMQASGRPFEVALAVTRAVNLFTSHTAVAAGFDRFSPELIKTISWLLCGAEATHHARKGPSRRQIRPGLDSGMGSIHPAARGAPARDLLERL